MSVLILALQIKLYLFSEILIQDFARQHARTITINTQLSVNVYLPAKVIIYLSITWHAQSYAHKVSMRILLVFVFHPVLELLLGKILQRHARVHV